MWRKEGRLNLRMDGWMDGGRVHASFFISETYSNCFSHFEVESRPIFTFGCTTVEKEVRAGEYASFFAARHPFFPPLFPSRNATASSGPPTWRIHASSYQWKYRDTRDFAAAFGAIFHRLEIKTTSAHCRQKRNCESAPSIHPTAAAVPLVAIGG